ncbi:conserved hypothetical protein [Candidatus Terasakiella magnetica]|nr:conserved hypothetical protein [Candidatus Terasakiella magnetica]
MKKLLVIGGVALTVIVGGVVFLLSTADTFIKKIIEDVGSQAAGVKVSVGAVKISLSDGKGTISGLTVANPPGFSNDPAFKLGEISLTLDTGSLTKNPIVVKEILVAAPAVAYELGSGGSNLDVLQKNVQAFAAKQGGGKTADKSSEKSAEKPAADKGGEAKKLVIDRLAITGGQVKLAAGGIPGANTTAKLGDIVLTGIGKDSGGASAAQVAQKVLDSLVNGAIRSGASLSNMVGTMADKAKTMVPGDMADKAKALIPGDAAGAVKGLLGK